MECRGGFGSAGGRLEGVGRRRGDGVALDQRTRDRQRQGGDVVGNLLNALAWLVDELTAAGTPLHRGMIVSMAAIQYPIAGDRVSVEVSELGTAELAVK